MSRSRKWFGLFLPLLILTACALWAAEQQATDSAMQAILGFKGEGFVNVKGERRGYIAAKGSLKQRIALFDKQDYLVVICGDEDLSKVNLVIEDGTGKKLMETTGGATAASLIYTPEKKGKYTFLFEAPEAGGYYHFSVVTK
ncbi:MAG: hypothetical protein HQL31_00670 [Planctomycetes bacterium]|nr:hypothetical protein [Planctomycetota bacterium]